MFSVITGLFKKLAPPAWSPFVPAGDDIARYLRRREAGRRLNGRLVGTIPRRAMDDVGAALGILRRNTLIFDSEDVMDVFSDCCLHDWVEDGANLVERYAAEAPPPADPDEREALDAMTRARYTILRLDGQVPHKGVRATDMRTGEAVFVIDMNLSMFCRLSGGCLATRLLPVGRFCTTSGAALPVPPGLAGAFLPGGVLGDPPAGEGPSELLDDHDAVLALVRCALASGSAEHVGYSEDLEPAGPGFRARPEPYGVPQATWPRRGPVTVEIAPPRRPSRNAPCPCGSGKLHKRCCGREEPRRRTA